MLVKKITSGILLACFVVTSTTSVYADSYKAKLNRVQNYPSPRPIPSKLQKMSPCEVNFVALLQGKLPADLAGNSAVNMWDELFDPKLMVDHIKTLDAAKRVEYLTELSKMATNDEVYAKNLAEVVTGLLKGRHVDMLDIRKIFLQSPINDTRFFWSNSSKKLTAQVEIPPEKIVLVDEFISGLELSKNTKKEYRRILLQSKLSKDQVKLAIDNGLELKQGKKYLKQFEEYIEYLDNLKPTGIKKGLKNIDEIYDFSFVPGKWSWATLSPQKKFLVQKARIQAFEDRRFIELLNDMKLRERNQVIDEIDDLVRREKAGETIDPRERARLFKKLDEIELPPSLRERALLQARGEAQILSKLRNGCNRGDSPVLRQTAKRFSRFKFALAMTSTPLFYYLKNKDKLGTDPYWFERLGYEMAMGLAFTFVANKIFTNGKTSFWKKYITSYLQFGALDMVSSVGYEKLFGASAMIRHLQQVYKPNTNQSELEREYEALMSGPDVQKNIEELLAYLEERSNDRNTKNFIEKYLNLGTYNQLEDDDRITLEDLESPEARELLMELVAERLYLQNMGNVGFFQTGSHGADRWAFYRARNVAWDIKGLVLNLAIFQIMCREPFGKAGSWMAVISLVMANELLSGDFTYQWRREAINQ